MVKTHGKHFSFNSKSDWRINISENHFLPTYLEFSYLKTAKALFLMTGYDVLNLVKKSLRYTNKTLRCLSK